MRAFQRGELAKELLGLAAGLVVLGVGGIFLGFLDAAGEVGAVDVADGDRRFGKQRAAGRHDVGKAAEHHIALFLAGQRSSP